MIKALALLFMLIDHIGMILLPEVDILRIIGRLSMPLFAYAVARGFYYSKKNGTISRYVRNLSLFALISQIPFTVLTIWVSNDFWFNIGVTWLLAVGLMQILMADKKPKEWVSLCALIFFIALVIPIDYGLYGVLYPTIFYLFFFRMNKPQYAFVGMLALYALYDIIRGSDIQLFSVLAFPILIIAKLWDNKVKLPRRFFYWFYPIHIIVLLIIKAVLDFM